MTGISLGSSEPPHPHPHQQLPTSINTAVSSFTTSSTSHTSNTSNPATSRRTSFTTSPNPSALAQIKHLAALANVDPASLTTQLDLLAHLGSAHSAHPSNTNTNTHTHSTSTLGHLSPSQLNQLNQMVQASQPQSHAQTQTQIHSTSTSTNTPSSNPLSRPGTAGTSASLSRPGTAGGLGGVGAIGAMSPLVPNLTGSTTRGATFGFSVGNGSGTGIGPGLGNGNGGGTASGSAIGTGVGGTPTNDDIEKVIQMATSSRAAGLAGSLNPPRDTRTQLFVGNLPYRVRWQDLKDLFRRAGTVLRADVSLGPDNRSRGYGTVLLATAEDAGRAVDMFNGFEWMTRVLEVRPDRMGTLVGGGPDDGNPALIGGAGAGVGVGVAGAGAATNANTTTGNGLGNGTSVGGFSSPVNASSPFGSGNATPFGVGVGGLSATPNLTVGVGVGGGRYALSGQNSPFMSTPDYGIGEDDMNSLAGRSLFVGNLPFHIQWQDLKDLFRMGGGTILRADVALGADGRSRGFGMVSFASEQDAERARAMFNGYEYNGRVLKVHFDKYAGTTMGLGGLGSSLNNNSNPNSSIPSPLSISQPHSPSATHSLAQSGVVGNGASFGLSGAHNLQIPQHSSGVSLAQQVLLSHHQQQQHQLSQLSHQRAELARFNSDSSAFRYTLDGEDHSNPTSLSSSSNTLNKSPTLSRAQSYPYTAEQHYALMQQKSQQQLQQQLYQYSAGSSNSRIPGQSSTGAYGGDTSQSGYRASPLYSSVTASGFDHDREEYAHIHPDSAGSSGHGRSPFSYDVDSVHSTEAVTSGSNHYDSRHSAETNERDPRFPSQFAVDAILGSSDFSRSLVPELQSSEGSSKAEENIARRSKGGPPGMHRSSSPSQQPSQAPTAAQSSSRPQTATTPGHHHQHPAHPGPISLPPPVTAFPIPPPHTLSPYHHPYHPMSPYMSPLYHPAMMGMPGMTPHGLPPITPSMPSFTFLPQPSPMAPGHSYPPSSSAALGGEQINGTTEERQGDQGGEGESGRNSGGESTTTGVTDPKPRPPALPHIPPHQPPQHHPFMASHPQLYSPYTPFSPGVTMSPGAFWGRPGTGGNPYINPAVGAPVHPHSAGPMTPHHMQTPHGPIPPPFYAMRQPSMSEEAGYFPPVPSVQYAQQLAQVYTSQDGQQQQQQQPQMEEPQGYFPFIPPAASRPSGLSQEISASSGEGTSGGARSVPSSDPSVGGTGPSSMASPTRPGSSVGTSWTDSPKLESQQGQLQELAQEFKSLNMAEAGCPSGKGSNVSSHKVHADTSSTQPPPPLPRADSDPVVRQSDGTAVVSPDAEDGARAVGVDAHRSSSDSQTSRSKVL